jgi:hypothetical protein
MKRFVGGVLLSLLAATTAFSQRLQFDTEQYKDELIVTVQDAKGNVLPNATVAVTVQYRDAQINQQSLGSGKFRFWGFTPRNGQITVTASVGSFEQARRTLKWMLRDGKDETGGWTAVMTPLSGNEGRAQTSCPPPEPHAASYGPPRCVSEVTCYQPATYYTYYQQPCQPQYTYVQQCSAPYAQCPAPVVYYYPAW